MTLADMLGAFNMETPLMIGQGALAPAPAMGQQGWGYDVPKWTIGLHGIGDIMKGGSGSQAVGKLAGKRREQENGGGTQRPRKSQIALRRIMSILQNPNVPEAARTRAMEELRQAGIPGYRRGTRSARGGLALVGEAGPELVEMPKGAKVYPNPKDLAFFDYLEEAIQGASRGNPKDLAFFDYLEEAIRGGQNRPPQDAPQSRPLGIGGNPYSQRGARSGRVGNPEALRGGGDDPLATGQTARAAPASGRMPRETPAGPRGEFDYMGPEKSDGLMMPGMDYNPFSDPVRRQEFDDLLPSEKEQFRELIRRGLGLDEALAPPGFNPRETRFDDANAYRTADMSQLQPSGVGETNELHSAARSFQGFMRSLEDYEKLFKDGGSTMWPGARRDELSTAHRDLQMQMKELYNLGVLNGPDLELMNQILLNPTSVGGNVMDALGVADMEDRIPSNIENVRRMMINRTVPALQQLGVDYKTLMPGGRAASELSDEELLKALQGGS